LTSQVLRYTLIAQYHQGYTRYTSRVSLGLVVYLGRRLGGGVVLLKKVSFAEADWEPRPLAASSVDQWSGEIHSKAKTWRFEAHRCLTDDYPQLM